MKLYAEVISENEIQLSWDSNKELGEGGKGWYEIEREPDYDNREYLEYNVVDDIIEIKQRPKTQDEIDVEDETTKKEGIRMLYKEMEEFGVLRKTLKKIRDGVTGVDFTEFDKYNQDVEDILNK